jgi:hydrogenase expression/formation protein HypD
MNLVNFNDKNIADKLLKEIHGCAGRLDAVKIMEVCGTHTMEIGRLGLRSLLPENIELVSGPGCPVCVTPGAYIDAAVELALGKQIHIITYGDMVRVPGNRASLEEAKVRGAKIHIVTSPFQALNLARQNPDYEFVFLAVGFETTAPATAKALLEADETGIGNLTFFLSHRMVPPALAALIDGKDLDISGFMLPGHVSAIIGEAPYQFLADQGIPSAITGFEPIDILMGILDLCIMVRDGTPKVVNAYSRIVRKEGNPLAVAAYEKTFEPGDAVWRGIGTIPRSGLDIRDKYKNFDAAGKYGLSVDSPEMARQPDKCRCGAVMKGKIRPNACPLFAVACTPRSPFGPCMVSSEGSCAAYYKYEMTV